VVVLCTTPPGISGTLARFLVENRMAACVNIAPVRSCYRWDGEVCDEAEELLIIKTEMRKLDDVSISIKEIIPYEVPEIIVLPIVGGEERYLGWISEMVG